MHEAPFRVFVHNANTVDVARGSEYSQAIVVEQTVTYS